MQLSLDNLSAATEGYVAGEGGTEFVFIIVKALFFMLIPLKKYNGT